MPLQPVQGIQTTSLPEGNIPDDLENLPKAFVNYLFYFGKEKKCLIELEIENKTKQAKNYAFIHKEVQKFVFYFSNF